MLLRREVDQVMPIIDRELAEERARFAAKWSAKAMVSCRDCPYCKGVPGFLACPGCSGMIVPKEVALIQTLTVPNYLPPTKNTLLRLHWSKQTKIKRECKALIAAHAIEQGIVKANWKRRVTVKLTLAGRAKERDGDSSFLTVLDALTEAKLILDDSPKWLELMPLEQERGKAISTVIVLEDLA